MKRQVIIVAGGKGLRMGTELPKQFLPLQGKPVLMHTLDCFYRWDRSMRIILVLPSSQQSYWQALCKAHQYEVPHLIVDGGESRFHSVLNGLQKAFEVDDFESHESVIGVHDGVRPFVSQEVIMRCFAEAEQSGAAVPVISSVDSLRHVMGEPEKNDQPLLNRASEGVNRADFYLVQTPQVFRASLLKKAYKQNFSFDFTDDASVVERAGYPISLVEGGRENIKITTPFDLAVAELLVQCSPSTHLK